jgi:hypothetical protein
MPSHSLRATHTLPAGRAEAYNVFKTRQVTGVGLHGFLTPSVLSPYTPSQLLPGSDNFGDTRSPFSANPRQLQSALRATFQGAVEGMQRARGWKPRALLLRLGAAVGHRHQGRNSPKKALSRPASKAARCDFQ